jgi:RNA polymerase sigma-70 factor (family 1)
MMHMITNKNETDISLIIALIDGREDALQQLFDRYANDVYRIAYAVLKDSFESEDVVQEVFIKLWNARLRLDETGSIWSFIYVIARRVSLNKLRESRFKIAEQVFTLEADFSKDSDEDTIRKEILALENEVIKKLPGQQRTAYLLSRVEGLTYKEIADQMNIAPNTVKNHIIQALRTFKKYFRRFGYPLFLLFLIWN